jgi:hypothetical protein
VEAQLEMDKLRHNLDHADHIDTQAEPGSWMHPIGFHSHGRT